MSTVLVKYNTTGTSVATGATPANPDTPIADPQDCFLVTNVRGVFAVGSHCFTLLTEDTFRPLWINLELSGGQDATITFHRVATTS